MTESRMDQVVSIFEQGFTQHVRNNISESAKRIIEDVIDIASNNINEVLRQSLPNLLMSDSSVGASLGQASPATRL